MKTQGQGHSVTFFQGHSDSTFSNFFSSKNTWLFELKFHMEPPWDVGIKKCGNIPCHMTKMTSRPIYGKNLQKSPSLEPRADDLETWYTASGTQVLPSSYDDTGLTFTYLWHGQSFLMLLHGWKLIQHIVMYLKLDMGHWLQEYYQICSNDDLWLTITYFTTRTNLVDPNLVYNKVKFGPFCFCMRKMLKL